MESHYAYSAPAKGENAFQRRNALRGLAATESITLIYGLDVSNRQVQ
jgi:hypothetical protein